MKINEFTLPKNTWELLISNSDKQELGNDLVSLVKNAYANTDKGSFIRNIKDVLPSDWNIIDWDQDPDVDSTVFYRKNRADENWIGYKIQGLGHDGQRDSKDKAITRINLLLNKPGFWIEASHAMRHILKKAGAPIVTDENFLQRLFNDSALRMINDDTYTRMLGPRNMITESVFGFPKLK